MLVLCFVLWCVVSFTLGFGLTRGYFYNKYPTLEDSDEDFWFAVAIGVAAIGILPIVFILSERGKYGLLFKRPKKEKVDIK